MKRMMRKTAGLLALFMLLLCVQVPVLTSATETNGVSAGVLKYYVDGVQTLTVPTTVAGGKTITAEIKITNNSTETVNGVLIGALYHGTSLETAVPDIQTISAGSSKVLSAAVTAPNGTDSYTYKSFVWDGLETSMTPYTLATEALRLTAAPNGVNEIALSWDAADGWTSDSYQIYRGTDGEAMTLLATVSAGGYTDYMMADGTTYQYQIKSVENPARVSNIASAAPASAAPVLAAGAWIQAGLNDDGTAADTGNGTLGFPAMQKNLKHAKDTAFGTNTDKYTGYMTDRADGIGTDSSSTRVKGTMMPSTPRGTNLTEEQLAQVKAVAAADGTSAAFFSTIYGRIETAGWNTGKVPNINLSLNETGRTKFKDVANVSIFVEYWGTRTTNIRARYLNKESKYTETAIPVNTTAGQEWRTVRLDVEKADLTRDGKSGSWANIGESICFVADGDLLIRRVAIIPTASVPAGMRNEALFETVPTPRQAATAKVSFKDVGWKDGTGNQANAVKNEGITLRDGSVYDPSGKAIGDNQLTIVADGDEYCMNMVQNHTSAGYRTSKVRFRVDDSVIYGPKDSCLQFEITYKTNAAKMLNVNYQDAVANNKTVTVPLIKDGEKHTFYVDVADAKPGNYLWNAPGEATDFAFTCEANSTFDANSYLNIYSVTLRRGVNRVVQDISR